MSSPRIIFGSLFTLMVGGMAFNVALEFIWPNLFRFDDPLLGAITATVLCFLWIVGLGFWGQRFAHLRDTSVSLPSPLTISRALRRRKRITFYDRIGTVFWCIGLVLTMVPYLVATRGFTVRSEWWMLYSQSIIILGMVFIREKWLAWNAISRFRTRRPSILYLRAFRSDRIVSGLLEWRFMKLSPAYLQKIFMSYEIQLWRGAKRWANSNIAVGEPGAQMPRMGFTRVWLDASTWQENVLTFMSAADLILAEVHNSRWVTWELERIAEEKFDHKTVFVFFPSDDRNTRVKFEILFNVFPEFTLMADMDALDGLDLICCYKFPGQPITLIVGLPGDMVAYHDAILFAISELPISSSSMIRSPLVE